MNKDGETTEENLFENMSFGDDLIIEGAEIEQQEETVDKNKQTEEAIGSTNNDVNKNTGTTTADSNENQLIDFDEPSATEEQGNPSPSVEGNDNTGASSSSPLSLVTEALGAEGFIEIEEGELEGVEDYAQFLRDKLSKTIDEKAKSALSPKKLQALEAFEKGVPMEEFVNSNARQEQYSNISDQAINENEQLQQQLIAHSLRARGFSDDEIIDEIKTYKDVGGDKLKEKALSARKHLISEEEKNRERMIAEAEAAKAKAEENREKELSTLKERVNSQKEFIKGLELTDKVKDDIYKIMTTPVGKDANGNLVNEIGLLRDKDPQKFNMMLSYYYKLGLFNDEPDLSKLQKVAETKAVKSLDNLLGEGSAFMSKAGGTKDAKPREESDLGLDFI